MKPSQSLEGMVRVGGGVEGRGGSIIRVNKLVRGFGAGTGVWVEVGMGPSWDLKELGRVNSVVLFFLLHERSLWIAAVCSTAHL